MKSLLLASLSESAGWTTTVVHTGRCHSEYGHITIPEYTEVDQPYAVNPKILLESARYMRKIASDHDVVLSIDRTLPCPLPKPCVLMSNTLGYQTEATAVQAAQWAHIIAPTNVFAEAISVVNGTAQVHVVPYGLPEELLQEASSAPPIVWNSEGAIVRLPHRPEVRKGHREALEGLARALPESRNIRLEISWLNEPRDVPYRQELERLSHQLGIANQVSFCNWVNGSLRWRATAQSCAVLQLGSFEESFGLAIVENIVFGRPAVVRHQPAVAEIVRSTGLLLEIADSLEWYAALKTFFSRRDRSRAEIQNVENLIHSLSFAQMAAHYDRILTEAIESK